jgi:hypothetical protein
MIFWTVRVASAFCAASSSAVGCGGAAPPLDSFHADRGEYHLRPPNMAVAL